MCYRLVYFCDSFAKTSACKFIVSGKAFLESVDVLLKHCDVDILVAHLFKLFLIGKGIDVNVVGYHKCGIESQSEMTDHIVFCCPDYIHFIISI